MDCESTLKFAFHDLQKNALTSQLTKKKSVLVFSKYLAI